MKDITNIDIPIKTLVLPQRNALGQDLFNKVCEHLDLLERDYYGLVMWDSPSTRVFIYQAGILYSIFDKQKLIQFFKCNRSVFIDSGMAGQC